MAYEHLLEMAERYDKSRQQLQELKSQLTALKAQQADYQDLLAYYQSDWLADYEASNQADFPTQFQHDILSQDAIYDLITDYQALAITLIETGLSLLKGP